MNYNCRFVFGIGLSIIIPIISNAQKDKSAIFEDKDGKSSILLPSTYIGTNLSDESLELRMFLNSKLLFEDRKITDSTGFTFNKWTNDDTILAKIPKNRKLNTIYNTKDIRYDIDNSSIKIVGKGWEEKVDIKIEQTIYLEDYLEVIEEKIITTKTTNEQLVSKADNKVVSIKYNSEETEKIIYFENSAANIAIKNPALNKPKTQISSKVKTEDFGQYELITTTNIFKEIKFSNPKPKKVIIKKTRIIYDTDAKVKHKHVSKPIFAGLTLKSKANNGFASVFNDNEFTIGTNFDFHIGTTNFLFRRYKRIMKSGHKILQERTPLWNGSDWLTLSIGLQTNSYKIVDPDPTIPINKQEFRGFNIGINYTTLLMGVWLFGLSGNVKESNNINALKQVEYNNSQTQSNPPTNRTIESKGKGYLGEYKVNNEYNLNVDIVRFILAKGINTNFAINPYYRLIASEGNKPNTRGGLGIYVIQPSNFRTMFGIFFEYDDVFDIQNQKGMDIDRLTIGVTLKQEFGRKKIEKIKI